MKPARGILSARAPAHGLRWRAALLLHAVIGIAFSALVVACSPSPGESAEASQAGAAGMSPGSNGGAGSVAGAAGPSSGAGGTGGEMADRRDSDAGGFDAHDPAAKMPLTTTLDAGNLQACMKPSIDHLQSWSVVQGSTTPAGGSLLVKEDDHYVAKVVLHGTSWHALLLPLANVVYDTIMVDLSTSTGFTLTYSATADLWIQMRPANHPHGAVHWVTKIPSTGGVLQSRFFSLAAESWSNLPAISGIPPWPYVETRAQARGFVFVGNKPNDVVFAGLRFDNYVPACRP